MPRLLRENLEYGDLKRLVHDELHIDEYKSKMGEDADVCVVSFKISGKEPAADLVNFIEKGYDWVLDADVSAGEKEDGDYLVFIECERSKDLPEQIYSMMSDVMNLTEQSLEDWRVRYYKSLNDHLITVEELAKIIPLTAKEYNEKYGSDEDEEEEEEVDTDKDLKHLNQLKSAAGLDVDTKAPKNEFTESLRIAAGIK